MKTRFWLSVLAGLLATSLAAADTLSFSKRGTAVSTHERKSLETLVPSETVKVFEFHESKERSYRAISLKKLLDKIYGPDWRKEDDVVFKCADGYEPVIPVEEIAGREAFVALEAADGQPFEHQPKPPKPGPIAYGPYYLVWKNIGNPTVLADGDRNWPYQLVAMDLVRFADRYPKLAPPAHSPKAVREGFALYRAHCVNCHTLNGEGGTAAGVELNKPVSVTRYWRRDWLMRWIEKSTDVRESSKMPPFVTSTTHALPKVEERRQIEKIVRYLEAMAK